MNSFSTVLRNSALLASLAWTLLASELCGQEVHPAPTDTNGTAPPVADLATAWPLGQVRSFQQLCELAESISQQEYRPQAPLPKPLNEFQYDDYIKIQFRPERATWWNQDLPFWLETFHRGFVQTDKVQLFTLSPLAGGLPICQRVSFSKNDFTYDNPLNASEIPAAGHAGLRIVGQLPGRPDAEEMMTFVGSSYFRARSGDTVYGSSSRGLAINVALNLEEEFPDFRAFWVQRPEKNSEKLELLALLDSPSVSGAYRFQFKPGAYLAKTDVLAELYFRKLPEKVGIAPLTSMWTWGDGLKGPPKDQRPSVHDSDGLLIRTGDQNWRWRAYARQSYPSVTSISIDQLVGFGVLQRNRAFFHYDDHNARYHERPSVWVTPNEPWNSGRVELLELPGAHEGVDNIAAYWIPDDLPDVGEPYRLSYCVEFFAGDPPDHNQMAKATNLSVDRSDDCIAMEIRFAGPAIRSLAAEDQPEIKSNSVRGKLYETKISRTDTGDWILTTSIAPEGDAPVEIDLQLLSNGQIVSERFTYLLPPVEPEFVYPAVYTRQE